MEDITVIVEGEETTEVSLIEETTVLVREYKAGKNIEIDDNIINCTYEYTLPSNVVKDSSYVHTDNNYTTEEKKKLASLENADLSDYYTKTETNNAISSSLGDYYTKQETRTMINQDLESYYTKEQTDSAINTALGNYYTKTETDSKISTLESNIGTNYYTKTQTDNAINTAISNVTTDIEGDIAGSYYNKTEVNNLIASVSGASTASEVSITDSGSYFISTDVEGALQEIGASLAGVATALATQSGVVQ